MEWHVLYYASIIVIDLLTTDKVKVGYKIQKYKTFQRAILKVKHLLSKFNMLYCSKANLPVNQGTLKLRYSKIEPIYTIY